jgi:hypothetical protein
MVELYAELHKAATYPSDRTHPAWRTWDEYEDASHSIIQIGIERLPCFGECPAYAAVLHATGLVEYTGHVHVGRLGDHCGRVNLYEFHRLAQFIAATRFWEMGSHYDFRDSVVSDGPAACVLVATRARRKLVGNYMDAGPPELWAIAGLIDLLLLRVEWEPRTAEPHGAPDRAGDK